VTRDILIFDLDGTLIDSMAPLVDDLREFAALLMTL
jgi:beta-phosphoglucomutase-like phosphatase (HAD superfamily)